MEINLIIYLLFVHWISDFVCQSQEIAKEKSKNNIILYGHCCLYAFIFAFASLNPLYGVVLGAIHFPVDYVTSRISKKLYEKGDIHKFFVCVGLDQFIHMATIILVGGKIL